eukprot:m.238908 g.238908  ORF g.238908 m.238908 type:complete len:139 (+) comp33732_c0_seq7:3-419(+)
MMVYIRRTRTREKYRLQLGVNPQFGALEATNRTFNPLHFSSSPMTTTPNSVTSSSTSSDLSANHRIYQSTLEAATTTTTPTTTKTAVASALPVYEHVYDSVQRVSKSAVCNDAQYEIPRVEMDNYINLTSVDEEGYVA